MYLFGKGTQIYLTYSDAVQLSRVIVICSFWSSVGRYGDETVGHKLNEVRLLTMFAIYLCNVAIVFLQENDATYAIEEDSDLNDDEGDNDDASEADGAPVQMKISAGFIRRGLATAARDVRRAHQ